MNSIYALRKVIEMVQSDKITVVKSDLSKNYTNKELAELSLAQLCNIYRAKDFMTLLGYEILEGGTDKSLLIEVDRALFERLEMEREGGRVSDDFVGYVQAILTEGTEFANKAKINMGIENYTISGIEDRTCNMKGRDYYDNTGKFEAFINLFVSKSANDVIIRNKPISLENFKWYHDLLMHGDSTTRVNTLTLKMGGLSSLFGKAKNEFGYKALYALVNAHNNIRIVDKKTDVVKGFDIIDMLVGDAVTPVDAVDVTVPEEMIDVLSQAEYALPLTHNGNTYKEALDRTLNSIPVKYRKLFFKISERISVLHLSVQYMNKKPSTSKKQLLEDAYDLLEDVNFGIDDIKDDAAKAPSASQSSYDLAIQYFTTQSDRLLFIIKEINDLATKKDNKLNTIKDAIPEEYRQYLAW